MTKGRCDEEHMTVAITAHLLADSTRRASTMVGVSKATSRGVMHAVRDVWYAAGAC